MKKKTWATYGMISGTVGYLVDGSVIHRIYATDLWEIGMIVLRMARATRCRAGLSLHILKLIVAGIKMAQGLESTRYRSNRTRRQFAIGYPYDPHDFMYYVSDSMSVGPITKVFSVRPDTKSWWWCCPLVNEAIRCRSNTKVGGFNTGLC